MTGPLSGLRVIEFAGLGPGPFCAMMLADHGAEVIRIDRLGGNALVSDPKRDFLNRSRKSIEIDLKDERGLALARHLCASADALVEGFRPGVMERLGLGPEPLMSANRKLVYGRMTGWGQEGPYADLAGHDINYIALSGALHAIGPKDAKPVAPLNLVGDFGGGGMMLAFGMLAAMSHAQRTGEGQIVDCAMTDGSAVLMSMMYSLRAQNAWRDERGANVLDGAAPYYDTYETADGKYVAVGAVEPQFYRLLLQLLGLGDEVDASAQNNKRLWPALKQRIAQIFRTKARAEWCAIFEGADACFAPVLGLDEAPTHPHNQLRGTFVEIEGAVQPAPAPRYSRSPTARPSPMRFGADAVDEVLTTAGCAPNDIKALRAAGVVQ